MKRCLICGHRIWPWQKKSFYRDVAFYTFWHSSHNGEGGPPVKIGEEWH